MYAGVYDYALCTGNLSYTDFYDYVNKIQKSKKRT